MQLLNEFQEAMRWWKRLPRNPIDFLDIRREEYEVLLSLYPYGSMERIIFRFTWETGCRPWEVVKLARTNFSKDFRECIYIAAKGKDLPKPRHVYLSEDFAEEMEAYCNLLISPYGFLFPCRYTGKPVIPPKFLNNEMTRKRKKLYIMTGNSRWIQKDNQGNHILRPYSFRYGFVRRSLEGGVPIEELAKYMGHSDPRTTFQYAWQSKSKFKFKGIAAREPGVGRIMIDEAQMGLAAFSKPIEAI
jgi:integrase